MAEIKLYGNTVNGDGKYVLSPFDIAAPKSDGKSSYVEDDKDPSKNIVSYINSKVSSINTSIVNVKTGVSSATFTPLTIAPALKSDSSVSSQINLAVLAKDGSTAKGGFTITLPSANKIVTTASSYTNLVSVVKQLDTSYNALKNTVSTINAASGVGSFRQGDADTLATAKKYADDKISYLGKVYRVQGTKSLAEIKAITSFSEGDVYNISEAFKIDGKPYSEYTNIVFLKDLEVITWDETNGFDGSEVDGLGGVQDLSGYSLKEDTITTIIVNDSNEALSDTGSETRIAKLVFQKYNNITQAPVYITAKLPTTLAKINSPKLETQNNTIKLTGLGDLSGITVLPLSYESVTSSIISTSGSETYPQNFSIKVTGELGSVSTSIPISLTKSSKTAYGVVKIGNGLNVTDGAVSAQMNTFTNTPYVSITTTTPNITNGTDFVFDIVCNTATPGSSIIPLQKVDSTTLGIKFSIANNTYIKLKQSNLSLGIDETNLTNKITSIETRITALETLLSLA